jgi:hypothetical protein
MVEGLNNDDGVGLQTRRGKKEDEREGKEVVH